VAKKGSKKAEKKGTKKGPKKEKKGSLTPAEQAEAIRAALAKKGVHLVRAADLITNQSIRRPFGVPSLDVEIAGGAGSGAATILYGPYGAGKTLLTMWNLREAQRTYGKDFKGLFLSLGLPLDRPYARIHRLKIPFNKEEKEEFIALYQGYHGQPPTPQEIKEAGATMGQLDFLFADYSSPRALERVLEGFLTLVSTRTYQLAVVDDLGALPPREIAEKKLGDDPRRGAFARLFGEFTQKLNLFLQYHQGKFNPTSVLVTSQARKSMMPGDNFTLPFGEALKHNTAAVIRVRKDVDKEGGQKIVWKIARGKYGHGDGARGVLLFNPYSGIDRTMDLVTTAVMYEVIHRAGTSHFSYGEFGGIGYDPLCNYVEEHGLYDEIWEKVLRKKGILMRTS